MEKVEYTSEIVSLIQKGEKLEAIAEIRKNYGISLVEAKNMVNTYKGGEEFYFLSTDDNDKTIETNSSISEPTTTPTRSVKVQTKVLPFACPNCGDTQVHKSIGGHAEQMATWAAAKVVVMGAKYLSQSLFSTSFDTYGVEGRVAKHYTPAQYVCDYCHNTFHATKAKIDDGGYSMDKDRADRLKASYNKKLQTVKDKEVKNIREKGYYQRLKTLVPAFVFFLGLLICIGCEHTTEGYFGMTRYTLPFMFSWLVMFGGIIATIIGGSICYNTYKQASEIEHMSIEEYAKNHKAE